MVHYRAMNKLDKQDRAKIIHLLCEGMSIRAITRLTGVSKTTVSKLVVDAGEAAAWYQDRVFQSLTCKRLQIDEIWGFVGAKQKNVAGNEAPDVDAGDVWLWLATDADTKLVPCWHVGGRDGDAAMEFIDDLASRLPTASRSRRTAIAPTSTRSIRRSAARSIMRAREALWRSTGRPSAAIAPPNAPGSSRRA